MHETVVLIELLRRHQHQQWRSFTSNICCVNLFRSSSGTSTVFAVMSSFTETNCYWRWNKVQIYFAHYQFHTHFCYHHYASLHALSTVKAKISMSISSSSSTFARNRFQYRHCCVTFFFLLFFYCASWINCLINNTSFFYFFQPPQ